MTASHPFDPRPPSPTTHTHQETQAGHAHQESQAKHVHNNHPYNNTHNYHQHTYNHHHQEQHQHAQTHSHNDHSHYYNYNNNNIHAVPEVPAVHEHIQPAKESPQPSALWLLNHPAVNRELQRMALSLVERQRRTDDPGASPCLFVVLPKTSRGLFSASALPSPGTKTAALGSSKSDRNEKEEEQEEYWLYFLCDFMMPESTMPQLHVCSPPLPPSLAPPQTQPVHHRGYPKYSDHPSHFLFPSTGTRSTITTYPGGYQLRDLEKFLSLNALPMLSLLYLVDQANGPDNSPEWTDRIRGGIRFLAEKCKEDLVDIFEEDTQLSPSPEMDSEGGRCGYPRDDVEQEEDLVEDAEDWDRESEEDDDNEEKEEDEEDDGDEEAESGLMRLWESDFLDPWRVAGKAAATNSRSSSINSLDGINFGNLNLNHHSHTPEQQRQEIPLGSTVAGASEGGGEGALILGADVLCQVNHPFIPGGILWLCEAHNEMLCKGMAAEKLRQFIKSKKGNCIPMEKSAEIQFREREDARVFYRMLDEYKCVIKLKIGLDFDVLEGGVTEEDLWELCWAIHCSTVRDLTVDCGGGGGGASFRPMLGMMCRMGFVALTVENFDGSFLSPNELLFTHNTSRRSSRSSSASYQTNAEVESSPSPSSVASQQQHFSLVDFRASPTIMALPDNMQLKKLTFRHWTRVPDRKAIANLIRVLPNLAELETMTDSVEMLCQAIQDELQVQAHMETSRASYHPLSHLNLLEVGPYGSDVEFTLSKPSGPEGNIRISGTHWKTNQSPRGLRLLQTPIGLETLEFKQCVGLWEMGPELQRIVGCNFSTLRRVEIVCSTEWMADVWVLLRREFMQPTTLGSPGASSISSGSYVTSSSSPSETGFHHSRRVSGGSDNSSSHHQQRQRYHQLKQRGPVHLLIRDRAGHILESTNVEQYDQTILDLGQYDESFRPQLELQSQIASQLRISPGFVDLQQLDLLSQDMGVVLRRARKERLAFCLKELVICLTRRTFGDVAFLEAIWNLMGHLQGLQSLTIQMYNDGSTFSSNNKAPGGRQGKGQGQDEMPQRLLEALRRVGRIEVGPYWNERFERWMQELLVQQVLPIRTGVAFPPGLPVQGGFVFGATEDIVWGEDALLSGGDEGRVAGGAGVVYSLTLYRP